MMEITQVSATYWILCSLKVRELGPAFQTKLVTEKTITAAPIAKSANAGAALVFTALESTRTGFVLFPESRPTTYKLAPLKIPEMEKMSAQSTLKVANSGGPRLRLTRSKRINPEPAVRIAISPARIFVHAFGNVMMKSVAHKVSDTAMPQRGMMGVAIKILVTGAGGMLGRSLVKELELNGAYEVIPWTRKVGDLRDAAVVNAGFKNYSPDIVVHCAAKVGGIQANIAEPYSYLIENLKLDDTVRHASIHAGVRQMIYLGSSCMYPANFRQPLKETDVLAAPLESTNEGYALAKIVGSRSMTYASTQFDLDYKTVIASNLYGPGDNFDPLSSHLVAAALRKAHEAKSTGSSDLEIWGDGHARREFTYVADLANWLSDSMPEIGSLPDTLNVGVGEDFSVREYYEHAAKVVDFQGNLVFDTSKPAGMKQKLMDSTIARRDYRWAPRTTLEIGLRETYEYYLGTL